ncbi:MAG: tetratricopeptide repeat protein [Alphaproteobacteria bacterium]
MYLLKNFIIFLLFIFLNINLVYSQSVELRESLKDTKIFYKDGKLRAAVNSALDAIEFSKNDFGEQHYYTATLIENLGIIQYELLMYEEAKKSFIEVLNIRKITLNQDHTDIAESLNYIALTNRKLFKYDDAIIYHNEALLVMSRSITKSNPHAINEKTRKGAIFKASALHTKALIEIKNKNVNDAIGLLKASSKIFYNTLGKDKSQLIESYEELIKLALDNNNIELANKTKQKLKNIENSI